MMDGLNMAAPVHATRVYPNKSDQTPFMKGCQTSTIYNPSQLKYTTLRVPDLMVAPQG